MINSGFPKNTEKGVIGSFRQGVESAYSGALYPRICKAVTSTAKQEVLPWIGATASFREWIGSRLAQGHSQQSITIVNKDWENTLEFPLDDWNDDQTGQMAEAANEQGVQAINLWDERLSTLIEAGNASTYSLAYDGQYFYDDDHSEGSSGTLKNTLAAGDYAELNVSTTTNPTATELAPAVLKVIQHFYTLKNDKGQPMNGSARSFILHVPANMMGAALQVCNLLWVSSTASGTTTTIQNPILGVTGLTVIPFVDPRLTGTSVFYVHRADAMAKGFVHQLREPATFKVLGPGSEFTAQNDKVQFLAKTRGEIHYGLWQHSIKATLS